jgi:hypothetical protein
MKSADPQSAIAEWVVSVVGIQGGGNIRHLRSVAAPNGALHSISIANSGSMHMYVLELLREPDGTWHVTSGGGGTVAPASNVPTGSFSIMWNRRRAVITGLGIDRAVATVRAEDSRHRVAVDTVDGGCALLKIASPRFPIRLRLIDGQGDAISERVWAGRGHGPLARIRRQLNVRGARRKRKRPQSAGN